MHPHEAVLERCCEVGESSIERSFPGGAVRVTFAFVPMPSSGRLAKVGLRNSSLGVIEPSSPTPCFLDLEKSFFGIFSESGEYRKCMVTQRWY